MHPHIREKEEKTDWIKNIISSEVDVKVDKWLNFRVPHLIRILLQYVSAEETLTG